MRMTRQAAIASIQKKYNQYTLEYTGSYTQTEITAGGRRYMLYTFLTSGVLTIDGDARGDIYLIGGGANGSSIGGGGGGYTFETIGAPIESGTITIGAGNGGATIYGAHRANGGSGKDGASGGGGTGATALGGIGQGRSTRPWGDTVNFTQLPGGGGGGGGRSNAGTSVPGGDGGSDGNNGEKSGASGSGATEGTGGETGGGNGGYGGSQVARRNGEPANYYGSGGGSRGFYNGTAGTDGAGYQGVAYIRIRIAA